MKKISKRQYIINKCLTIIREQNKLRTGRQCEICHRHESWLPFPLQNFHILNRQKYPRLILHRENILLTCGTMYMNNRNFCHDIYHHCSHDEPEYKRLIHRIKKLRGEDYEIRLKALDKIQPQMTLNYLSMYYEALKKEVATADDNHTKRIRND